MLERPEGVREGARCVVHFLHVANGDIGVAVCGARYRDSIMVGWNTSSPSRSMKYGALTSRMPQLRAAPAPMPLVEMTVNRESFFAKPSDNPLRLRQLIRPRL